jgi:hypothetical protein
MLRFSSIAMVAATIAFVGCASPSEPDARSISDRDRVSLLEIDCNDFPNDPQCTNNNNPPGSNPPASLPPCANRVTSAGQTMASPTPATDSTFPLALEGTFDLSGCASPAVYRILDSPIPTAQLEIYWFVSDCRETLISSCTTSRFHFLGGGQGSDSLLLSATDGQSSGVFTRNVYAVGVHPASGRSSVSSTFWSRDMSSATFNGPAVCNRGTTYLAPGPLERVITRNGSQVVETYSRNLCSGDKENVGERPFP